MASHSADDSTPPTATVLVYASQAETRERVMTALGRNSVPGLALTFVEAGRGDDVVKRLDAGDIDLVILDGEAAPTGGMGLARQLKDEVDAPPPVLLIVGRRDDAWLATWSRAEAVVAHPLDAMQIAQAVTALLAPAAAVH